MNAAATSALSTLSRAARMLAIVKDAKDAKKLIDVAAAATYYAKKAGLGEEAIGHAHAIKIEAQALLGKFWSEAPKRTATHSRGGGSKGSKRNPLPGAPATLADLGVSKRDAAEAKALADIKENDPDTFEKIRTRKVTVRKMIRKRSQAKKRQAEPTPIPKGRFDVILADPPWQYDFAESGNREVENQYPTLDIEAISALPVPAADDAVLFLWATSPKLVEAMRTMASWGFSYVTQAVWVKDKIGMGYWFRQQHEVLLVGRRGDFSPPADNARHSSVFEAPRLKHSAKPQSVYGAIELMFPNARRLEMFARSRRPGWEPWGNEWE